MPKVNTLFSYFTKTPPSSNKAKAQNSEANGSKIQLSSPKTPNINGTQDGKGFPFKLNELVWARLEGYPWWPSLIKKDPDEGIYYKTDKLIMGHVEFFGEHTRAWIKLRNLKKYRGPKHPDIVPPDEDNGWNLAVEEAEEMRLKSNSPQNDAENVSPKSDDSEKSSKAAVHGSHNAKRKGQGVENGSVKKRRRIIIDSGSEDSEDEYKPDESGSESDNVSSGVEEVEVGDEDAETSEEDETPKKSKAKQSLKTPKVKPSGRKNSSINVSTKSKLSMFASTEGSPSGKPAIGDENKVWAHLKLEWLKDGNRKDIKGRPQNHPDYDPHTLYIPESYKKTMTPALKQWWSVKAQHFDTVLFFKVGKFYELYHMDAVIGVNELGLIFMKGDFAHSGFPEISYGRYSDALIQRGYKVARVEQTETPQMMEERCKHLARPTKYDRVVTREVCRITTKGTKTLSFMDDGAADQASSYLLSLVEKYDEGISGDESQYGVCFIDTTIGKFHLGQFKDDRHGSRMRTLVAHFPPAQVLYMPGKLSAKSQKMLNGCLASVLKEAIRPSSDYKDASRTLQSLSSGGYFTSEDSDKASATWPQVLKNMLDENDPLNQTPKDEYLLAVQALGICVWYLKDCCIEEELLSMKNFEEYNPVDLPTKQDVTEMSYEKFQQHMVLDGVTLQNLEVLENNSGGLEGTLLHTMDCTVTAFGKRLFRQWICSPLCNPASISDRLNAVDDLHAVPEIVSDAIKKMKKLPDLERLLSKIHTQASARRSKNHPDSRAIFYEDITYSKRKINDFLAALQGFAASLEIIECFGKACHKFSSKVLKKCMTYKSDGGHFPDLKEALLFFDNAFDHERAKKEGKIIPCKGIDSEYDNALAELKETEAELGDYLKEQCRKFGCKVTYVGSGRTRYQIEVPEHATKRVTDEYELQSQRKGFKRYWTQEVKDLLAKMMNAEEHRDAALKDIMRRIFASFDKRIKEWEAAVQCLSVLDALISLSEFSSSFQDTCCRPEFVLPEVGSQPFLEICDGYHPCLMKAFGGDFIPNDIYIGCNPNGDNQGGKQHSGSLVLVTGPNMGGKSTLMRQTGLIAIMAQMGSYIPATSVRITPVDRVFTRLGASDRIMAGESTFFVELSETASILQHATRHSLVLMDELGRGTATYDGTAIACAVVQELAHKTKCRALFSTHYHSLVDEFSSDPNVQLGHMSCMVENENKDDPTKEIITFLYKFVEGACPKSYGFNVAQLAGIPEEAIKKGFRKAKQLEQFIEERKLFRLFMTVSAASEIRAFHKELLDLKER